MTQEGSDPAARVAVDGPGKVAFLFPGQGSQRPGALADLFVAFPELRHYLDLGREWADLLFPPSAFDEATEQAQADRVRDTRVAQPVLGIGGLAVDHVLRRLGVRPDMAGRTQLRRVGGALHRRCVRRGDAARPQQGTRPRHPRRGRRRPGNDGGCHRNRGEVDAVLSAAGLTGEVVLANHNAPSQVVISGPTAAVDEAVAALQEARISAEALPVAAAFHSPVVAAGADTFAAVLANRQVSAPRSRCG